MTSHGPISRRAVLTGAGVATAAVVTGCRSRKGSDDSSTGEGSPVTTPTHRPFTAVQPDLPGDASGLVPGFYRYPDDPPAITAAPLPSTDPITFMTQGQPPQTALGKRNPWYRAQAEAYGNDFAFQWANFAEYKSKFQVAVAGDDLPELVQVSTVAKLPQLLEAKFTDLSDLLAGDAVEQWPSLAAMPTDMWQIPTLGGRIWGVTQPRPKLSNVVMFNTEVGAQAGITGEVALDGVEDFIELCREVTDRGSDRFALGGEPIDWILPIFNQMFGGPPGWREDADGTFVHQYETEEYAQAFEAVVQIWNEGLCHPQSLTSPDLRPNWYQSNVTAMQVLAYEFAGGSLFREPVGQILDLPLADGSGRAPSYLKPAGYGAFVGISKQASQQRVRECLDLINAFAAPFGSSEYLLNRYGVEGTHYTMSDGVPTVDEDNSARHANSSSYYLGNPYTVVLFHPGHDDVTDELHAYLQERLPDAVGDPTWELYSEWVSGNVAAAQRDVRDAMTGVLRGDSSMDAFTTAVEAFTADFADRARDEYARARENGGIA